jgi:hypothetical protein
MPDCVCFLSAMNISQEIQAYAGERDESNLPFVFLDPGIRRGERAKSNSFCKPLISWDCICLHVSKCFAHQPGDPGLRRGGAKSAL